MAYKNVVDNSSTTVSANTPGWTVDLRNHTTHRLRSVGVPCRFKICVNSTTGGDTGAVKLVDSSGTSVMTCLVNNPAATSSTVGDWYWVDGYVPASLAKYDVHYGGNTTGSLTVFSASLYEIDWTTDPVTGSMSTTLGALTVSAYVPFNGDMSATLGALTLTSAGTVDVIGTASQTLGAMTVSGAGTVATVTPATYQAIGTPSGSSADVSPTWPTHAVDDIAILLVAQVIAGDPTPPAVPTLSPSSGFVRGALPTETRSDTHSVRVTAWYCRATSTSMAAPTVLLGGAGDQNAVIITFRNCTTSGDPTDVSSTGTNTGTAISIGAATTTVANTVVCSFAGAFAARNYTSWTNATLTSFTERVDNGTSATISAATGGLASAASYGTSTATLRSSSVWAGFSFALKPA